MTRTIPYKEKKKKIWSLKALKKKLTEKERIFCHEYIMDWNGTRAAKVAGYAHTAATQMASRALAKVYIKQYIAFIKDDIATNLMLSKTKLIAELQKMAFSNITDIYENWVTRKDFIKLKQTHPHVLAAIQEIDTKVVKVNRKDEDPLYVEYVKLKMYDKKGAIQDILRAMGWNEPSQAEKTEEAIILDFAGSVGMDQYLTDAG